MSSRYSARAPSSTLSASVPSDIEVVFLRFFAMPLRLSSLILPLITHDSRLDPNHVSTRTYLDPFLWTEETPKTPKQVKLKTGPVECQQGTILVVGVDS